MFADCEDKSIRNLVIYRPLDVCDTVQIGSKQTKAVLDQVSQADRNHYE